MKNDQRLRKGDIIKNKDGLYFVISNLYRRLGYVLGVAIVNNLPSIYKTRVKIDNFTKVQHIYITISSKKYELYDSVHKNKQKIHITILPITKQSKKLFEIDNSKDCIVKLHMLSYRTRYIKVVNVQKSLCFENQLFLTYEDI